MSYQYGFDDQPFHVQAPVYLVMLLIFGGMGFCIGKARMDADRCFNDISIGKPLQTKHRIIESAIGDRVSCRAWNYEIMGMPSGECAVEVENGVVVGKKIIW